MLGKIKATKVALALFVIAVAISLSPKAFATEVIKLTLSSYMPPSYTYIYEPLVKFVDNVNKLSGGRLNVEFFHSGQLFGAKDELGALERGEIDMSAPVDNYNTGNIPALGITSMPFLWATPKKLLNSIDAGLWGQGINQALAQRNVIVLNVAVGGPYHVFSKGAPVMSPDDFKGKTWAVSGGAASKAIDELGGAPATISSAELYLALQRGTINGAVRPFLTGLGRKLYEVSENMTILNMFYFTSFLSINKKKWDSLPADLQQVIKDAAKTRGEESYALLEKYLSEGSAKMTAAGVKVHALDENSSKSFKAKMVPVYKWWESSYSDAGKLVKFANDHQ